MVIWDYDVPLSASVVGWAVLINNVAGLEMLLDCGYLRATVLVGIGAACRWVVGFRILRLIGLARPIGAFDGIGQWFGLV